MTQTVHQLDFSDLEAQFAIPENPSLDSCVVIANLPLVDAAKESKLLTVIKKIFKNIGNVRDLCMPKDASGKSKGFIFMDFETPEMAALAVKQGDGYKLDKSHILAVHHFDDIEKYAAMDTTFVEPVVEEFTPKEHLKSWLADEKARDQFVMLKGEQVGIYYNNKGEKPDLVYSRNNWTDTYVGFSPKGLYLATVHKQGIALWGGKSWNKIVRFAHPAVKLFDFSPNEKYITTWSYETFTTKEGEQHNICVWDIVTGRLLRSFYVQPTPTESGRQSAATAKIDWPLFKWSFDDKYLAKMVSGPDGMIQVYETPGMGLLDKKSIKVENLMDIAWSPKNHTLSYWTPESGNIPARVSLVSIPSREILRTKNLFGVLDCKLYWQSSGDYLLVKVDRAKTKKSTVTSFELYRIREKEVPVDVMEAIPNEEVSGVFWEPRGTRFVVLSSEGQKSNAHFYQLNLDKTDLSGGVKHIRSVEAKGVNTVSWSPKGRFCILAGVRGHQGTLQFWDTEENTLMASEEHYACTDLEWDPTGRYVISGVSGWHIQTDTGFMMWTFTGTLLTRQMVPGYKTFLWRPRPESLLSKEEKKAIRKNLKEYSREFDVEDAAESNRASQEVIDRRISQWAAWKALAQDWSKRYESEKKERIALYGFDPDEVLMENDDWVEVGDD